jgi:murein DD-endopeptidase MepM/ murein hydrolase activator NlpD
MAVQDWRAEEQRRRVCFALIGGVLLGGLLTGAVQAAAANGAASNGAAVTGAPDLLPPVNPACISSPFGPRVLANRPLAGTYHNGVDLPAPEGAPVHAVAPGTVIRVQRHGVGGLEMLVQHAGFVGVYSHLGHVAPLIAEGRRTLYGGQVLGTVGRSGVSYGMHLYFGMLRDGHPIDPAPALGVARCGIGEAAGTLGGSAARRGIGPTRVYVGTE